MQAIGEVLSSSITGFSAEAWLNHGDTENIDAPKQPAFGSFLKSKSESRKLSVIGVVFDIVTGPQDLHHKPTALRMTRAELKREQPQIFSLLKTEWQIAVVGYSVDGICRSGLPPFPPEVHDFVFPLQDEELLQISENLDFLRMLANVPGVPTDELLAATIRFAAAARHNDYKYLVNAGQHVSQLFPNDFDRLGSVLRKIKP